MSTGCERPELRHVWTMADEMHLIRQGGELTTLQALSPSKDMRVVPLCLRRRNGDLQELPGTPVLHRTPVRTTSVPAHLLFTEDRNSLVPVLTLTRDDGARDGDDRSPSLLQGTGLSQWSLSSGSFVVDFEHSPSPSSYPLHAAARTGNKSIFTRAQTLVSFVGPKRLISKMTSL